MELCLGSCCHPEHCCSGHLSAGWLPAASQRVAHADRHTPSVRQLAAEQAPLAGGSAALAPVIVHDKSRACMAVWLLFTGSRAGMTREA